MTTTTTESLRVLARHQGRPCVSLFLHRTGDPASDRRRFEAMVVRAEGLLDELGRERGQLAPFWRLAGTGEFFRPHHGDAAIFLAPGLMLELAVQHRVEDEVVVGERFHIRPLLAPPSSESFVVLALHSDRVRAYIGDAAGLHLAGVGLPSRHEVATHDLIDRHLPATSVPVEHARKRSDGDAAHRQTRAYYHVVAAAVRASALAQHGAIVLAGTPRDVAAFREVARRLPIAHDAVALDPDALSPTKLHAQVLAVAEPVLSGAWRRAEARFHERGNEDPVERELSAILAAAERGLVDTLLLARGAHARGSWTDGAAQVRAIDGAADEDLLNRAAVETIRHGGRAYEVGQADLEPGVHAIAMLRYLEDRYAAPLPPAAAAASAKGTP